MTAYYNERDPFAAAWLRNLITANMIAPGDVDERSIEDVVPLELARYTQCHFFAGIGVWSYAMRRAGWPDDRPSWSGSCPCQPFSQAGQGSAFDDERHLWPAFFHLIEQCRPDTVFGEQVASPDGLAWFDLVQSDMEGTNYAFGAVDQCAAGFGAPHIRQRLYWMANNNNTGLEGRNERRNGADERITWPYGMASGLEYASGSSQHGWPPSGQQSICDPRNAVSGVADTFNGQLQETGARSSGRTGQPRASEALNGTGPTNGFWGFTDWLRCKDERWRPVEPGTFPLAHGVANRMGLLRGYGNAIVAPQAEEFIKAAMAYVP